MTRAANAFANTLTSSVQKAAIDATAENSNTAVLYNPLLQNVVVWSDATVSLNGGATRNGLMFAGLTMSQRKAAMDVAHEALSPPGMKLFDEIRAADRFISGEVTNDLHTKNPDWGFGKYFIAFVGQPSNSAPWTLQFSGHHLAYNITYNGRFLSGTPLFAGSEPISWKDETGEHYPLKAQREILEHLRPTLTTDAQLSESYTDVKFGPDGVDAPLNTTNHDNNQPKDYPVLDLGQLYTNLTADQQKMVRDYIVSWVGLIDKARADELLAIYLSQPALAETYVAYSGTATDLNESGSYFRVDGPRLWIEFAVLAGDFDPTHVHDHAVWRDKLADYGAAYGDTTIAIGVRPPSITTQPTDLTVKEGESATFTVVAQSEGAGTPTLTYQWFKDCCPIPEATAASFTIPAATKRDAGHYLVKVITTGGLTTSTDAKLTVEGKSRDSGSGPQGGPASFRGGHPGQRR